ncbi:helix-turn-helix domain-containing protein [Flavihumibacter sp. UBA7668]|uniref:helix-turn-helix domain-containing protein n=1 Tax=Flavihumibacter sp. UBA7668 TaxID=1946542 RepID=UPI0025B8956B|nr:response regulator transcription factor [Flavihumibacter sp. UBA7668]
MSNRKIQTIQSLAEFHTLCGLSGPEHPLISMIDYSKVVYNTGDSNVLTWVQQFYLIGMKRNVNGKLQYGQQKYDFDEGLMTFVAPGQVLSFTVERSEVRPSGFLLLIHPDFLWNSTLASRIKQFDFFGYGVNEALFLSEKEEAVIAELLKLIQQEYHSSIDAYSQSIIISQIEVVLNYCERFYQRQFITRKIINHQVLSRLEQVLETYFSSDSIVEKGLPSVQQIATEINMSPNYLSSLVKSLTGQSTQQLIHEKLIEKAKEKLSATNLSVSEIAYELGFEHSQSFSKLFKSKTAQSPLEFRAKFN